MAEKKTSVSISGQQVVQLAAQEKRRFEEIAARMERFQEFRRELVAAKDALEEISKSEKGTKMLVSLGAGVFAEAEVENNKEAISTLSGSVFRKKSAKEIAKTLEKKIANMDKTMEATAQEQQKAFARLNQLENVLAAGRQYTQSQRADRA